MELALETKNNYSVYDIDDIAHGFIDALTERVNTLSNETLSAWNQGSLSVYAKFGTKIALMTHAVIKSSSFLGLIEASLAVKGAKLVQNFLSEPSTSPIQNTLGIVSNEALAISADVVTATQNRIANHPEVYEDPKTLAILVPLAAAATYYGYSAALKGCAALELLHLGYLAYAYKDSFTGSSFSNALESAQEFDVKALSNQTTTFLNQAVHEWNQLSPANKALSATATTAALVVGGYAVYNVATSAATIVGMGFALAKVLGQAYLLYETSTLLLPKAV